MTNLMNFGRITQYNHNYSVHYSVPINKIPLLNWFLSILSILAITNGLLLLYIKDSWVIILSIHSETLLKIIILSC